MAENTMKIFILIIWLSAGYPAPRAAMTQVVFQSSQACEAALSAAHAKENSVSGVCVPQGREQ